MVRRSLFLAIAIGVFTVASASARFIGWDPYLYVNSHTAGVQVSPDAALDDAGNCVIVWQSDDPNDAAATGIMGRRFAADGTPFSADFQIAPAGSAPAVAVTSTGAFAVVWIGSDRNVWARRYGADGAAAGAALQVSSGGDVAGKVAVAIKDDGSFVVVWDIEGDDCNTSVRAQWFDANGARAANGNVGQTTLAWRIKAIGDFDGDSRDDVFVQNSSTGESAVWLINGTTITTGAVVTAGNPAWVARGAGDFNGDYRDDVILQNTNTGEVAVWFMNGLTITGGAIVAAPPAGWQIRTVADIDGDDKADVILQNTNSSEVAIWKMNGFNVVAGSVIGGASGWIVKGAADFNGDATPDILLHSESNGQFAMWRMNPNFTINAGAVFAQTATQWRPALQP